MTGKELIIYILTHNLTDTKILSENMFLGFPTLSEVAVHNKCGLATIDAYIDMGILESVSFNGTIYIVPTSLKNLINSKDMRGDE